MDESLRQLERRAQLSLDGFPRYIDTLVKIGQSLPDLHPWLHWICDDCEQPAKAYHTYDPLHCCISNQDYAAGQRQSLSVRIVSEYNILDYLIKQCFTLRQSLGPDPIPYPTFLEQVKQVSRSKYGQLDLENLLSSGLEILAPTIEIVARLKIPEHQFESWRYWTQKDVIKSPQEAFRRDYEHNSYRFRLGMKVISLREFLQEINILELVTRTVREQDRLGDDLDTLVDANSAGFVPNFVYPLRVVSVTEVRTSDVPRRGARASQPEYYPTNAAKTVMTEIAVRPEDKYVNIIRVGTTG